MLDLQAGSIITGVIVDIDYQSRWVTVHAGLKKSPVRIPLEQFKNDAGDLTIQPGDEVHLASDLVERHMTEVNSKGPAPIQVLASDSPSLPEDIGTLTLRYVDGVPQLVVSGGKVIPASLAVVDGSGVVVASYAAQADPATATISARNNACLIVTPA